MPLLPFEPASGVNSRATAGQHTQLLMLINQVRTIVVEDRARSQLLPVLDQFNDLCVQLFSREELLMLETGYPGYQAHKAEHDRALEATFGFDGGRLVRDPQAATALFLLMREWQLAHCRADRELALYLRACLSPRQSPDN